ncbi:probable E3 ubiquitin ligase SUD1 [Papaver somniferum]|uniref:probable E3 ubiquitin ligase SUD1 n=1 Tax=Papaver somniferum TaxID=3469 RepID=UPI000E6FD42B|nr:probable E3 ubiquitin ligase SUD1 [Papaver somniferum]XP_026394074.1 probable E3 ubiquitin ligase SUD1 [Papaver somniferum]
MEGGLETRENMKERVEEDDEEEEMICRICHSPGDSQNPLQYPCACSGSMKFVHPKCLLQWMAQRMSLECEVCKHKYYVYRVYAENTPTRLPFREFVGGIAMKACHVLLFCVRFCFSVSQQLLMPPLIASWIWRLSLVRCLSEAKELVDSHMSASTAMMDWLYGFVISNILFVMLLCGITLIREDEEDAEDRAHVAIAPTPGNENHIDDEIGEDDGEPQAIAGVRNDENMAPGLRLLVILLVDPLLQSFQAVMIAIFRFNVPLRSTCIYLVMSILFFLITNGVLILVPFSLGRIILHCLSWIFFAASSIFMPFIESALSIGNNSLKNASPAITNLSAEIQKDGLLSCAIEVVTETLTANVIGPGEALSSVGKPLSVYRSSGLYDVITLATGYMVVVSLVFVCYPLASKIRYYLRKFQTMMIYPFFLIIHLIVLPLVYGWWLDVCTITMLGKSFSDRIEFLLKFPLLSSSMHWAAGIIYMFQIHISTSLLQRVLLKEVLYILQYLADPIDIILHGLISHVYLQASRLLFSVAINGISIVF